MTRPRIGRNRAVFPPGYTPPRLFRAAIYAPATRSRRVRRFFWELPDSRLRTYTVASYYDLLVKELSESNFKFLGAVAEDAELTVFTLGTYRGPAGWKEALSTWRETLDVGLEMSECATNGEHSLIAIRFTGRGSFSGLSVDDLNYLVVRIHKGQAREGMFFRERSEALEAAGLSE